MLITNPNIVMPNPRPTPVFPVEPVDRPGASRPVGVIIACGSLRSLIYYFRHWI